MARVVVGLPVGLQMGAIGLGLNTCSQNCWPTIKVIAPMPLNLIWVFENLVNFQIDAKKQAQPSFMKVAFLNLNSFHNAVFKFLVKLFSKKNSFPESEKNLNSWCAK